MEEVAKNENNSSRKTDRPTVTWLSQNNCQNLVFPRFDCVSIAHPSIVSSTVPGFVTSEVVLQAWVEKSSNLELHRLKLKRQIETISALAPQHTWTLVIKRQKMHRAELNSLKKCGGWLFFFFNNLCKEWFNATKVKRWSCKRVKYIKLWKQC